MLATPVITAGFIQVNKTVKSLIRYCTIMPKREITIIKFDQIDVMIAIRNHLLHTGGRKMNKDMYARLILTCVGSNEA